MTARHHRFTGPIRISDNGRHFVDRDGAPFFWLGDTCWPLFTQYTYAEACAYLRNRAKRGFTVIQCVMAWPGSQAYGGRPGLARFPWKKAPARLNASFFVHVDKVVDYARRQGLVLAILPTWGNYVNNDKVLTRDNARAYARYVGARYRSAPNAIWVNGGDRYPKGFEGVYRELAAGLRDGDGGAHLITYHICGCHTTAQHFHDEDWLDFNMLQTWTDWDRVYQCVSSDYGRTPVKPVVHGEGAYENGPEYPKGPISPLIARRQAWWAFLAGGFHTYGQDQVWRMSKGWQTTFDTPGAQHMGVLAGILRNIRWWDAVPDQSLFVSGVGEGRTLNAAVIGRDGSWALAYLSSQIQVQLFLTKIRAARVRATLVNPATGERKPAGIHETGLRKIVPFPQAKAEWFATPAHWEDAVVLLETE